MLKQSSGVGPLPLVETLIELPPAAHHAELSEMEGVAHHVMLPERGPDKAVPRCSDEPACYPARAERDLASGDQFCLCYVIHFHVSGNGRRPTFGAGPRR